MTEVPATAASGRVRRVRRHDPNYKWIALSNTTLGVLMAAIDGSIVIISLPAIFNGIKLDPLEPGSTSYLLWIFMGYLLVTAVLVVAFGWLGDRYGRVRMYNAGFAIFTVGSLLLAATPFEGSAGALWIIGMRIVQGIGGAFLFANSAAILTDAFPTHQRGLALGINGIAAIAGQFIGLLAGGFLATIEWRLVFFVSVPIGIIGTIWAYLRLEELSTTSHRRMDWAGNLTFGIGLAAILIGITYGIQPYGSDPTGWTSPLVIGLIGGGLVLLAGVPVARAAGRAIPSSTCPSSASGPSWPATWPASSPPRAAAASRSCWSSGCRGSGCRCTATATPTPRCGPASTCCR